jgi:hypothetical protein
VRVVGEGEKGSSIRKAAKEARCPIGHANPEAAPHCKEYLRSRDISLDPPVI